jgi:hypothetical protein
MMGAARTAWPAVDHAGIEVWGGGRHVYRADKPRAQQDDEPTQITAEDNTGNLLDCYTGAMRARFTPSTREVMLS